MDGLEYVKRGGARWENEKKKGIKERMIIFTCGP